MNRPGRSIRRLIFITVPAIVVATIASAALTEAWVWLTWDLKQGSPGLFVSDPTRGQRLVANYNGWFAGVPVRTNSLGFRDEREYALEKGPTTFRILVLGDSVTFGHGAIWENTYPRLLERLLREWKPAIDWQVWNAAVPGYNTSQELAQLLELGSLVKPDLVIVGFYENDLIDNEPIRAPGALGVATSRALSFVQRHVYSFELYKKAALQLAANLSGSIDYRRRLEHLDTEARLLAPLDEILDSPAQRLTPYERLTDEQVAQLKCPDVTDDPAIIGAMQREPGWENWLRAVQGFQDLNRRGLYRVVFFLNIVPAICPDGDYFYEGASRRVNDFLLDIMGDSAPAVSSLDAFMHRRPSQMPAATAHAIGNANMTKAETLFEFLRETVLK